MKTYLRLVLSVLVLLPELAQAAPVLRLQIVQRPPYLMISPNGDISGISVGPTVAAFKKAGIPIKWEEVPALRQLERLAHNQERVCSVGWYKTAERERFAKFTDPISQDSPWVGFANSSFTPPPHATVAAVLADPRMTVLLKNGYVYGAYLDKYIAAMKAQREETTGDMSQVFKMIAAGRAQITFAPLEEIQYYLNAHLISATNTKIIAFKEIPAGYQRYLMCSKQVEDAVIKQFNAALQAR